jgi:hypothetical protein
MAGFRIHKSIIDLPCAKLPCSSLTAAVGDLIELITGEATVWTACTSSSNNFTRKAIVMETATAASSVLAMELTGNELVAAESNAASAVADNGNLMVLTDTNTVNNTGTTSAAQVACFLQTGTLGATTDKVLLGYVIVGNSVDPDAT